MPSLRKISNAIIQGEIKSIPTYKNNKMQWHFLISQINQDSAKALVLLSCYKGCPHVQVGQRWEFHANLQRPNNLANPGSFDYVTFLKARHILWTGFVKGRGHLISSPKSQNILFLREYLAKLLRQAITDFNILGIVQALTLGVTTNISPELWGLFRRTGTTHLLVISGAHIGLIATLTYKLLKWLWGGRLSLYYSSIKIASIFAILMAFIYSLLSGFAVPAQRAVAACIFLLVRNFLNFKFTGWQCLRYGLFFVLLFEPHAVLLPGFYLSFIAVTILIVVGQRFAWRGFGKIIYVQLACLIGLMPLTLYWFSYGAINGLLANLLAIPLIGFIIVPFALISLLLYYLTAINEIFLPVSLLIKTLLIYLNWVDKLEILNLNFSFASTSAPIAVLLALTVFVLLPLKNIYLPSVILITASFFPQANRIKGGDVNIEILDVAQGLAVVIRTASHTLIYDSGAKFFQSDGDMAKFVIIPYLNTLGIKKIDKIIISHPDLDHRGGLESLERNYPNTELIVDNVSYYKRGSSCHLYPNWQWDGVDFRFFAIKKKFPDKNNNSCVLQISNPAGKSLLTGDLEKKAEEYLIATYGKNLQSNILLVPHHGSKTSSSPRFVKHVEPNYAIISAGLDNRYHFPHQQTLRTLEFNNVKVYNTIECGMTTFSLLAKRNKILQYCYKKS